MFPRCAQLRASVCRLSTTKYKLQKPEICEILTFLRTTINFVCSVYTTFRWSCIFSFCISAFPDILLAPVNVCKPGCTANLRTSGNSLIFVIIIYDIFSQICIFPIYYIVFCFYILILSKSSFSGQTFELSFALDMRSY